MPNVTLRNLINTGDPITAPDGTVLAGTQITFQLVDTVRSKTISLFDAVSGELIVGAPITITTDIKGEFVVPLWPNSRGETLTAYKVSVDNENIKPFLIRIDDLPGDVSLVHARAAVLQMSPQELSLFDNVLAESLASAQVATEAAVVAVTKAAEAAQSVGEAISVSTSIQADTATAVTSAATAVSAAATATSAADIAVIEATAASVSADYSLESSQTASSSAAITVSIADSLNATLVSFRSTFLGHKASDPLVDDNGGVLMDGVTYVNTISQKIRVYDLETDAWADYDAGVQLSATSAALSAANAAGSAAAAAASELASLGYKNSTESNAAAALSSQQTVTAAAAMVADDLVSVLAASSIASTAAVTATTKATEAGVSAAAALVSKNAAHVDAMATGVDRLAVAADKTAVLGSLSAAAASVLAASNSAGLADTSAMAAIAAAGTAAIKADLATDKAAEAFASAEAAALAVVNSDVTTHAALTTTAHGGLLQIGTTEITAAAGIHLHAGVYAPVLGSDDNYITDAEKVALHSHANMTALDVVVDDGDGDKYLADDGSYKTVSSFNSSAHALIDHTALSGIPTQYTDAMAVLAAPAETTSTIKAALGITVLSGDNTGDQVLPTRSSLGVESTNNTSDYDKPVSAAQQIALDLKANASQVLTNVPAGAIFTDTVYTHPASHSPSIITQDTSNRFVTDTEKLAWSAKQDALTSGTNIKTINGASILGSGDIVITGGGAASITISGNLTIYIGQTTTLTITNYDSATAYSVSASLGAASVSGNTITYIAGEAAGTAVLTVTADSATRDVSITVLAAGIATPTNTSPINGAVDQAGNITLVASVFDWVGLADTHASTDWEVATDSGFTTIVKSSTADSSNKTSISFTGLTLSTLYYWRVKYHGAARSSVWSTPTTFTTITAGVSQPTNTSPADAATGQMGSVALTASAFGWVGVSTTHLSSDWEVATDSDFTTVVASSAADETNKTSWTVTGLSVSTTYYWRVRYKGANSVVSAYSIPFSFATASAFDAYIATPTATPAAFGDPLEGGFYTGMIWNELVQSVASTSIATGSKSFTVADMTATPLVYSGQTLEVRSRANPANKMIGVVTGAIGTTLTINVTSVGGSGTFTGWSIMAQYRVIVAPKSSGESSAKTFKVDRTDAPTACQTLSEGRKATLAMVAAGDATAYPAAWFCAGLTIGSKADWYLPARDELELCWRNLKPTADANYTAARADSAINYTNLGSLDDVDTGMGRNLNSSPGGAAYTTGTPAQVAAGKNYRTGESEAFAYGSYAYWSSSEDSTTYAWIQYWYSSYPGAQYNTNKYDSYYVRAVRRSII